ncbi:MAG: metal-dependent hydrolase [Halococcoides sp.]
MELTWFGHSTWRVGIESTTLLVDPFFDNPKTDADPTDVDPDYVLLTHGHADHVADVGAYDCPVAGTPEVVGYCEEAFDVGETIGFNLGGTIDLGDAHVTMHRADHSNGMETAPDATGGMPAGYLIGAAPPLDSGDDPLFYHAGDTALMSEMADVIGEYLQPDVAAVPIGDHFTMGPEQAAIAVDWVGADLALPMHYDSFPPIEVDTAEFVEAVESRSDARALVCEADDPIAIDSELGVAAD